jgi:hypothetical protein
VTVTSKHRPVIVKLPFMGASCWIWTNARRRLSPVSALSLLSFFPLLVVLISPSAPSALAPAPSPSPSPSSDDSEVIEDLSFDYIFDNGNIVRTSKGQLKSSRESSSPATPDDRSFLANQADLLKPPSPLPALSLPNDHGRRSSLSRSESYSVPNVLVQPESTSAQSVSQARSFQRVASVPASISTTPGNASSFRAMRPLRRVPGEDRDSNQDPRLLAGRVPVIDEHLQEEKENLGGGTNGRPVSFPLPSEYQDEFPYMATSSTPGPPSSKPQGPTRLVMPVRSRVDAYSATAARSQQAGVQRSQSQTHRGVQRLGASRSASVSFGKVETIRPSDPAEEETDLGALRATSACSFF